MQKIYHLSWFLGLTLTSFSLSAHEEALTNGVPTLNMPEIHYSLTSDGREWKIANKSDNNDISITQYVVDNDQNGDCCELLSVMYIKDLNTTPEKNFDLFAEELRKQAGVPVKTAIISKDANSLLGEWSIHENSPNDMHEWIRIFSDGKNTAILKYTTTKINDIENTGKKWEKILSEATYS